MWTSETSVVFFKSLEIKYYVKKKGRTQSIIPKNEEWEPAGRALFILGNNRLLWGIFFYLKHVLPSVEVSLRDNAPVSLSEL